MSSPEPTIEATPNAAARRHKMLLSELNEAINILVKEYKLNLLQKVTLQRVAQDTQWVPSVEDVEWLANEAQLEENTPHKLPIWLFPYMEFYPCYLRNDGEGGKEYRLFLGIFNYFTGIVWELWAGVQSTATGPKICLHHTCPKPEEEEEVESELKPSERRYLTWLPSIDLCFRLDDMLPEDLDAKEPNEEAAGRQNSHIVGIMKVLARFPGMIVDRDDYDDYLRRQVYPEFKAFPFKHREVSSENNPLSELFKLLCTTGEEKPDSDDSDDENGTPKADPDGSRDGTLKKTAKTAKTSKKVGDDGQPDSEVWYQSGVDLEARDEIKSKKGDGDTAEAR